MLLRSHDELLGNVIEYFKDPKHFNENQERKLLDTLLGALNIQVQREPHSMKHLIMEKELVVPNQIEYPPTQVCCLYVNVCYLLIHLSSARRYPHRT